MSVHYKFKSALDFDTITFDGLHINVADLKKAIVHQKRLGKTTDFDLQITNAQTKEVYSDDNTLIPKNTSLIIARVPLAQSGKKNFDNSAANAPERTVSAPRGHVSAEAGEVDLSKMTGSEEDKINAMMAQSTIDYDPTNYQKVRGGQVGEVPPNYRCHRCHKPGHWIKNCPLGPIPKELHVKRNTGIPRSFLERDENQEAESTIPRPVPEPKVEIPEDLICSICKDLFVDAVMIPCCGSSFCDECVRTALLESEDNECPDCFEKGTSPSSLIPNRFLRTSVNNFKNETGYIAPRKPPPRKAVDQVEADSKEKVEPDTTTVSKVEDGDTPSSDGKDKGDQSPPSRQLSDDEKEQRSPCSEGVRTPQDNDNNYNEPISNIVGVTTQVQPPIDDVPYLQNQPIRRIEGLPPMQGGYGQQQQQNQQMGYPPSMGNNMMGGPPPMYNMRMPPSGPGGYYPRGPYDHSMPMYHHRPPYGHRFPGPHMHRPRPPMIPNVRQIYQEVQQTVGTGIIDDPLEAFNRIMREKEKKKSGRRSPPPFVRDRRSRSKEAAPRRRRRSRSFERENRSIRGRPSPDRERDRKKRRSRSRNASRSPKSFSRSRSRSPRKFSPSPKRRTRSPDRINSPAKHPMKRYDTKRMDDRGQRNERRERSPPRETRHRPSHKDDPRDTRDSRVRQRTPPRIVPRPQSIAPPVYPATEVFPPEFGIMDSYSAPYHHIPTSDNTILPDTTGVDPKYNKIDEAPPGTIELPPPGVDTIERESWKIDQYAPPETESRRSEAGKSKDKRKRTESIHNTPDRKPARDETKSNKDKHLREDKHHSKDKKADKKEKKKKKEKDREEKESKKAKKHKREKGEKEKSKKHNAVSAKTSPEKTSPETAHQTPDIVPEIDQNTTEPESKSEPEVKAVETPAQSVSPNYLEPFLEAEDHHSDKEQAEGNGNDDDANAANETVLDLYDNIDLDVTTEISKDFGITEDEFLQLPEPSKWEKDEEPDTNAKTIEPPLSKPEIKDSKSDTAKVTNEVLKRAENALFTKSFVNVKPLLVEKGSDGSRSQSRSKDSSPLLSAVAKPDNHRSHQSLKITVASSEERHVKKTDSPIRKRPSIKDRLGAKVDNIKRRTPESKVERKSDRGGRVSDRRRSKSPDTRRRGERPPQSKPLERLDGGRNIRRALESSAAVVRGRSRDRDNRRDVRRRTPSRQDRNRNPGSSRPPPSSTRDKSVTKKAATDKSVRDKSGARDNKNVARKRTRSPDVASKNKTAKVEESEKKSDGNSSDSSSSTGSSTDSQGHKKKKKDKKKKSKKKSKAKKEKKKRKHKE